MKKVLVNENTLANIAEAIRVKNGELDSYYPSQMADKILAIEVGGGGDSGLPTEIDMTTNMYHYNTGGYWNYYGMWDWFLELVPQFKLTVFDLGSQAFFESKVEDLSHITIVTYNVGNRLFQNSAVTNLPNLWINTAVPNGANQLFNGCYRLRTIPDDYLLQRDETTGEVKTPNALWCVARNSTVSSATTSMFNSCYSLRKLPYIKGIELPNTSGTNFRMNSFCNKCYCLDEIVDLPVRTQTTSSNSYSGSFADCSRLKHFTFETNEDGTPIVATWSNQTIDLSTYVGYASSRSNITGWNSGITDETKITDDATYQALKDNLDSWTLDINYSRYNHNSAVETINSLPDCSSGSGNTIKFKAGSGALTDGGAINTLTAEEIAVATAKGWTVSM